MWPVALRWPRVSFQPSGVDPPVVQIVPTADKSAQPWHLIPTRICPCSYVLFPLTTLTFGVACACLGDPSLLVTRVSWLWSGWWRDCKNWIYWRIYPISVTLSLLAYLLTLGLSLWFSFSSSFFPGSLLYCYPSFFFLSFYILVHISNLTFFRAFVLRFQ